MSAKYHPPQCARSVSLIRAILIRDERTLVFAPHRAFSLCRGMNKLPYACARLQQDCNECSSAPGSYCINSGSTSCTVLCRVWPFYLRRSVVGIVLLEKLVVSPLHALVLMHPEKVYSSTFIRNVGLYCLWNRRLSCRNYESKTIPVICIGVCLSSVSALSTSSHNMHL